MPARGRPAVEDALAAGHIARMIRSRWLRLVLAVLALVAGHVSLARSAFGMTCARGDASGVVAPVADAAALASHAEAPPDAPAAPAAPALLTHCATSVAALPLPADVPAAALVSRVSAPPAGPEGRPASHAPAPPFHPPRTI